MPLILLIYLAITPLIESSNTPSCEVLTYNTSITIREDESLIITKTVDVQINNRKGDWVTKRSIWYNGKKNRILDFNAKLLNQYGDVIRSLKKKDIKDRSAIGGFVWYRDDFVKEFQLLHNQYPYRLQYSYTMKYAEYLEICDWDPYLHYKVPTKHASLELINKANKDISIWESDSAFSRSELGSNHFKWEIKNVDKLTREVNGPPLSERSPKVIIRPNDFNYGVKGSNQSWKTFGDWSLSLQGKCNDLSIADQEIFINLTKDMTSDHEKIKAIYNKMQDEVRYIYVGIKYGGLQSYPASYVSENKFGDCKALTTYMQSALAAVGIESYRTTVYAGDHPVKVIDSLPGHQSNHVILCVPLEKDTVWLENTSNTNPYNYLGSFTQNRKALLMKKGESKLVDLPAFDIEAVKSSRKYALELNDDRLEGQMTGQLQGGEYDDLIMFKSRLSQSEQANYLKKHSPHVTDLQIERSNRNNKTVIMESNISFTDLTKSYGPNKVIFLPKSDLIDLERPNERESELRIRKPDNLTDSIYIKIAPQYSQIKTSKDTVITHSEYSDTSYELNFSQLNQEVLCIRKFRQSTRSYPVGEDYQSYYQFIDKIKALERKTAITLRP